MRPAKLPTKAGVGLKAEHYQDILETRPNVGFFEIHAENYMGAGGPSHHFLERIRADYALSLHGVGLSIGGAGPLDTDHLQRLKLLNQRYEPGLFSEHLAWSTHQTHFYNDLLPLPYNEETLSIVADHIDEVQETLGRQMLLENPSSYLEFATSTMSEITFLKSLVKRTGCGLLLDINNVFVSATNLDYTPEGYIDEYPLDSVGEFHLGGHAEDIDEEGKPLLIDAHDREVSDPVWDLYRYTTTKSGGRPTLIEWDNDVPAWNHLYADAVQANDILSKLGSSDHAA